MRKKFDEQLFISKTNSQQADPLGLDERYL
jgi:hypothetical protein